MTLPDENSAGSPSRPSDADGRPDDETGLPWPRTWPGVYLLVTGSFVVWVVLLVVLERAFP